jgi:large subunit ribosomal protein L24
MALYKVNKPRHPQANFHVKKNDEVVVLTGTQQGKRGKVLQVLRDRSRVIIEGVNFIKKSARKSQEQPQGGIIEREGALHISKVMLAADYDSRKGNAKTTESEASKPAVKHTVKHAPKHAVKHHATHPAKHTAPKGKK